jgi:Bacterial toxin 47
MGAHDQTVLHDKDAHGSIHDDGRRFRPLGIDENPDVDNVAFSDAQLTPVFRYSGDKLISDAIHVHIRPFHETKWESLYSSLFGTGVKPTRFEPDEVEPSFTPIIDESYRVVGHLGWINMSQICIFTARDGTALDLQKAEPTRLSEEHWRRLWRLDHPSGLRLPPGLLKPATNSPPPRQPPPCRPSSAGSPLKPDFRDDDAFWDSLRRAPRKESEEQRHQNNFNFFLAAGGTALVGRAIAMDLWDSERDEMYWMEGYRCLTLVGPDGHLQGVLGVEKVHYEHESRNQRDLRLVLKVVDIALTIWMVIDIVTIPVALFRLGALVAEKASIWAIKLAADEAAKAALKLAEQEAKRALELGAREAAEAAAKAAEEKAAKTELRGVTSKLKPATEEEFGSGARRGVSAINRDSGARPFYGTSRNRPAAAWTFNPKVDVYVKTHDEAIAEAFRRTRAPMDEFVPTKVAKTAEGKTITVEWTVKTGPNRGAQVNIDDPRIVPSKNGPQAPHVGYRTAKGEVVGHVFPQEGVLASRSRIQRP